MDKAGGVTILMGNFLQTLGNKMFELKWLVVVAWVILLAGLGTAAAINMKPPTSNLSIPGTEAQKTFDRYGELFPDAGKATGQVVFAAKEGTITDRQAEIVELLDKIADVNNVTAVVSPFENPSGISDNNTIAYAMIQLDGELGSVDESTTNKIGSLVSSSTIPDMQIERGGDLIRQIPEEILGVGEIVGVGVALMVLLITLGSLIAAGMPIITALVTVGASAAGLFSLSKIIEINSTTPALAIMLGLAVGIDYSLFIVNRYRSLLLEGYDYKAAAARAIATAGNAVIFAATTVVIALVSLAVVQIPFITTMGLTAAATVAGAAIVAVTLVPAMLGIAGHRIFRGVTRQKIEKAQKRGPKPTISAPHSSRSWKIGALLTKRPIATILASVAAIAFISYPALDMQLGLPTDEHAAVDSTERRAYDLIAQGFGDGASGPLLLLVENMPATTDDDRQAVRTEMMNEYQKEVDRQTSEAQARLQQQAAQVTTLDEQIALQEQVAAQQAEGQRQQAAALAQIEEQVEQYASLARYLPIAEEAAELPHVASALPAMTTQDGSAGVIQLQPATSPSSSTTEELVATLRQADTRKALLGADSRATLGVTGSTAMQIDINDKLTAALPIYLAVVVGLSLVLLVVAFRSILIPIKATLGFLLSVAAMFGALVAVFQWGWFGIADAPGPIVSMIPIIGIGILFGLAMDYEFFLVSGMHEARQHTKDHRKAILRGFYQNARVVVAAAAIMVAVFAGFITNHDSTVQALGFALTIGIFIDAFIVRLMVVPAAMQLLGNSAWWLPKWLDRIVPHVSIEGDPVDEK